MKKFLKSLLQDEAGQQSTKRILAILGTLFLCTTMMITAFSHKTIEPSSELVSAIEVIVCVSIGATSLDKFANRTKQEE